MSSSDLIMGLSRLYHTNKEFKATIYGEIIWIYWRDITLWNQQSDVLVCRNGIWSSLFSDHNGHFFGGETPNLMIQTRFKGTKVPYFNMFNGRLGARA